MLRLSKGLSKGLVFAIALSSLVAISALARQAPSSTDGSGYVGNEACAPCHQKIYESYKRTSMAHASGPATDDLIPADFVHPPSRVHYRIYADGNRAWLTFERPGDAALNGKRQLLYYIGSGRRGKSYLFAVDRFLFESPVNWYANKHTWDMAPAYQDARQAPLNLPAYTSCLHCHVSGMKPPLKGTENRYDMPVFAYSGVSCERCHGPGAAHVKGGAIVNPAKLVPDWRDAVCMQCHLEGKVAIERRGRHVYDYRPGDNLSDYMRYYVLIDPQAQGLGAVSQVEALAGSMCKQKSGDKMSCTSCHDPHSSPPAEERVSYFRGKCLTCHGEAFGAKHHAEQSDCTACHMAAISSTDIVHTQVTDHRIPRRPGPAPRLEDLSPRSPRLQPFPPSPEAEQDTRDLALAWESLAKDGMPVAKTEAERLLRVAAGQNPPDAVVLSGLAYLEQTHGAIDHARDLYRRALAVDPYLIDAANNLGAIEAREGNLRNAIQLWDDAFGRAPARSTIGMNLARTFCDAGKADDARSFILRVLEFNPDMQAAKRLLQQINATPSACAH
ncbi:MAG TPA: tetratricopeptide repeat protein [Terriglobales bacterium]|nr:tetratricopeptide repeat protein [Terriglobales bacterium]